MKEPAKRGQTGNIAFVFLPDTAATNGDGKTGLTNASTNLKISVRREKSSAVTAYTGANILSITTLGTWEDPGVGNVRFKEVGADMPGVYELHFLDSLFDAADTSRKLIGMVQADGIADTPFEVPFVAIDAQDSVRAGLTALPNAAAGADGGLPLGDANGDVTVGSTTPTERNTLSDVILNYTPALPVFGGLFNRVTGIDTNASTLVSRLTALRAGYLDNLNTGGLVAAQSEVLSIQNNTRVVRSVPSIMERPDAASTTYVVEILLYDSAGNMEAPDAAPTLSVVNQAGTSRDGNLDSTTMAFVSTGRYKAVYTMDSAHAMEQLQFTFSVVEGGATRLYQNTSLVVDTTAVDFTSTDRTALNGLVTTLDALKGVGWSTETLKAIYDHIGTRLATAGYTAPDNANIAAGKTNTDTLLARLTETRAGYIDALVNLPADPADASDIASALSVITGYIDTEIAAIKLITDKLSNMIIGAAPNEKFTSNALSNAPAGGGGGSGGPRLE